MSREQLRFPEEWIDRDFDDEDDYYLDQEEYDEYLDIINYEDELEDSGGSLVPNTKKPNSPAPGDALEPERELVLV